MKSSRQYYAFCADDNYALPLAVTLMSLEAKLPVEKEAIFYILSNSLTLKNRELIQSSLKNDNIIIRWVHVESSPINKLPILEHFGRTAYLRLLLGENLDTNVEKVVYLDADMLIHKDPTNLWETELTFKPLAAVQGSNCKHYNELSIGPSPYFNSGVMVIDMNYWRSEKIGSRCIRWMQDNASSLHLADQDGLNKFYNGNWQKLDPRWNVFTQFYKSSKWKESPYSLPEIVQIASDAWITHYNGVTKPWTTPDYDLPSQKEFLSYVERSPWRGIQPRRPSSRHKSFLKLANKFGLLTR
jgi:lipopolysaccharide biosynthesis glycosyltransferase